MYLHIDMVQVERGSGGGGGSGSQCHVCRASGPLGAL